MDELDIKIVDIFIKTEIGETEIDTVRYFISKCSISDFEKLKDLDYDLSQNAE